MRNRIRTILAILLAAVFLLTGCRIFKKDVHTVLTLTNTTATASTNKVTVDLNAQGWDNAADATPITLTDGTIIFYDCDPVWIWK